MKTFIVILGILLAVGVVRSQAQRTPAEQIVSRIINSGGYDGGADKFLGRMGDASAVVVTKILGENNLVPTEVKNVLVVIHLSFSAPLLVETQEDRKPQTTLFLLRYLEFTTSDQKLKESIGEERKFVLDQFAKSIKSNTP